MSQATAPRLEITTSRQFAAWLADHRVSLAFTTYQSGKLFLIGLKPDGRLSIFERTFNRAMGLAADGPRLWLSTLFQLWRFDDVLEPGQERDGYDRLYVPMQAWTTGDIDVHDVAVDGTGRVVFVNTLFGCLATLADGYSFRPLWRPPFLSRLAAEDRCHLNGVALRDGRPAFVTAVSRSDVADGWRERRIDGGVVVDVASGAVVASGLSMPHSPRWHDGALWLLDSGNGFLCRLEPATGGLERIAFCPGYARGLAIHGRFAVVGISRAREDRTFRGLPLDEALAARDAEPRCGLLVVDLASGDVVHWLRIEGVVQELYDVAVLPRVVRPMALGFKTDEIRRTIRVAEPAEP